MIYQIKDNYYVKVGNKFVKLSFKFDDNDELVMTPINSEKIENNPNLVVKEVMFEKEKLNIAKSIRKNETKSFDKGSTFNKSFGKAKSFN